MHPSAVGIGLFCKIIFPEAHYLFCQWKERRMPACSSRIIEFQQLLIELQQPGPAVGPLPCVAVFELNKIVCFSLDLLLIEAVPEHSDNAVAQLYSGEL